MSEQTSPTDGNPPAPLIARPTVRLDGHPPRCRQCKGIAQSHDRVCGKCAVMFNGRRSGGTMPTLRYLDWYWGGRFPVTFWGEAQGRKR
jgi:hypothetical protein